jgi:hypothetical protein
MRYLKGLAMTTAALALGAGSASASNNFYSTGEKLSAPVTFHVREVVGTTMNFATTDGKTSIDTCTTSTFEGTRTASGGTPIADHIEILTLDECSRTTDILTTGSLEFSAGGTVTGNGTVVTINNGVTCRYGTGSGTHLGTLSTGEIAINAVLNEQEPKAFLCPDTAKWTASLVVLSPHDLTVK